MNGMHVKNFEITRRIVQIITIVTSMGLAPLGFFTPWSTERIVEQTQLGTGTFTSVYSVFHYNIYLGLAYFLPMIGLLAINGSVKRYFKRRAENISTVRVSPVETISVSQGGFNDQQSQSIGLRNVRMCIICGQPNNSNGSYCSYCGNQL